MNFLISAGHYFVFAIIVLAYLYITKKIADAKTTFNDDDEIEERSNLAVGLRRTGLYLGTAIALVGALIGQQSGFVNDIKQLLVDGFFVVVAMFVAQVINDKFILSSVNNDTEVVGGNTAVGLVEAAGFIASGLILNAAFSGEGGGFISGIIFFFLGQFALLLAFKTYQYFASFDVRHEIASGNSAAGLAVGGMLLSFGFILKASIEGPFVSWNSDLSSFVISAVTGIVLLAVLRKVIDWLFLPNTTIGIEISRDKNVSAIALTEGTVLALALIVSTVI